MTLLYAMCSIEETLSWFLLHQLITSSEAVSLSESIKSLIREITPQALHLVNGFGIPEYALFSPIATDWIKYNEVNNKGEWIHQPKL